MPVQEDILGLVHPGGEIRRPPLVGMQFLHQRAMRRCGSRPRQPPAEGQAHRRPPAWTSRPVIAPRGNSRRSHHPVLFYAGRETGGRDKHPAALIRRGRPARTGSRAARVPGHRGYRARDPRTAPPAPGRSATPVSWSRIISSIAERTRDLPPGVVVALPKPGNDKPLDPQQPGSEPAERDGHVDAPAKGEERSRAQRRDAAGAAHVLRRESRVHLECSS